MRLPHQVSMESGLEDRNNAAIEVPEMVQWQYVSMESGLEDRNNRRRRVRNPGPRNVSMESGLEDRNN